MNKNNTPSRFKMYDISPNPRRPSKTSKNKRNKTGRKNSKTLFDNEPFESKMPEIRNNTILKCFMTYSGS